PYACVLVMVTLYLAPSLLVAVDVILPEAYPYKAVVVSAPAMLPDPRPAQPLALASKLVFVKVLAVVVSPSTSSPLLPVLFWSLNALVLLVLVEITSPVLVSASVVAPARLVTVLDALFEPTANTWALVPSVATLMVCAPTLVPILIAVPP